MEGNRSFLSLSGSPTFIFRVVVVGMMFSTAIGFTYAVVSRSRFVNAFPGAGTPLVYWAFLVAGGIGFVALIGLLRWRRWAVWLYGVLTAASLALDGIARAPVAHQLAVLVGATAIFTLIYLNRGQFRASQAAAAD